MSQESFNVGLKNEEPEALRFRSDCSSLAMVLSTVLRSSYPVGHLGKAIPGQAIGSLSYR
jgi:hypothetical protein